MDTNYNFILLSSQKIILIERATGRKCTRPLAHRAAAHCARARAIHASPTSTKPNELSKNRKCKKSILVRNHKD